MTRPPVCQADENGRQRQRLPDLHANVEADDVCDEAVGGEREVLQLRGEAEAMEQAEDQHRQARIGLKAEIAPEPVHVLERLVHQRETDDRVDEVWIGAHSSEHARQQRHAVPDGEQADVLNNVLQLVEEEDHAHEKEQVVVSGHHVFGTQIHEWTNGPALQPLKEHGVLARHSMRVQSHGEDGEQQRRQRRLYRQLPIAACIFHDTCRTSH